MVVLFVIWIIQRSIEAKRSTFEEMMLLLQLIMFILSSSQIIEGPVRAPNEFCPISRGFYLLPVQECHDITATVPTGLTDRRIVKNGSQLVEEEKMIS